MTHPLSLKRRTLQTLGRFYLIAATKDGNVCDDDRKEAGVQRSGLSFFITDKATEDFPGCVLKNLLI